MSAISDLPKGCLVHVLGFIPLQQRLQTCALVSQTWQEAAAAATTSINKMQLTSERCTAILQWVSACAQQLSKLQLSTAAGTVNSADAAQLMPLPQPLPTLQSLQVFGMRLQLAAQASSPNALQSFPSLTELSFSSCFCQVGMQRLTALSALSRLQRLRLHIQVPAMQQSARPAPQWSLPTVDTWSHLKALTHLDLSDQHNVTDAVLEGLTCLAHLQDLLLYAAQLTVQGLAPLQRFPRLRRVQLELAPHMGHSLDGTLSSTPLLAQLPSLHHLKLFCWKELQPALLASLLPLQHLELRAWQRRGRPEELSALLGAISQLSNLTTLALEEVLVQSKPEEMPLGSAQQGELMPAICAALTASSALHTLRLQHAELPEGAWLHMFPAGRSMPALRQLHLQDIMQPLTDAEFELLVCCAQGLTGLTLLRVLHSRVSLEPLLQLTGLRELELLHLHGDSGARVMAQLTCLRRLQNDESNLSPAGLMRLTALKQLTHLHMHYSAESGSMPSAVKLRNQAPEWSTPDVCSQLVQMLDSYS